MKRINRLLAAIIIASTLYLNACKPESVDTEDARPTDALTPVNAAYSAIKTEAQRQHFRRQYDAHMARLLAVKREEVRRQAEAEERTRRAMVRKAAQVAVSRASAHVGPAQTYQATAYTAYCAGCSGITRTGHDLRASIYEDGRRVIATDPRYIPLGSLIRVTLADGTTFEAIASDTGGAIKGAIIDIAHQTKAEARQFGRQTVEIRFIRRGR